MSLTTSGRFFPFGGFKLLPADCPDRAVKSSFIPFKYSCSWPKRVSLGENRYISVTLELNLGKHWHFFYICVSAGDSIHSTRKNFIPPPIKSTLLRKLDKEMPSMLSLGESCKRISLSALELGQLFILVAYTPAKFSQINGSFVYFHSKQKREKKGD